MLVSLNLNIETVFPEYRFENIVFNIIFFINNIYK